MVTSWLNEGFSKDLGLRNLPPNAGIFFCLNIQTRKTTRGIKRQMATTTPMIEGTGEYTIIVNIANMSIAQRQDNSLKSHHSESQWSSCRRWRTEEAATADWFRWSCPPWSPARTYGRGPGSAGRFGCPLCLFLKHVCKREGGENLFTIWKHVSNCDHFFQSHVNNWMHDQRGREL